VTPQIQKVPGTFAEKGAWHRYREDFPVLRQTMHGKPLVYLDNGATTQKPKSVIDAVTRYYSAENANIHRGIYRLSEEATDAYEAAREKVRQFIGAGSREEIIFVRGATEAINLVAQTWGRVSLKAGDEILITGMEHHSNIVPWQMLAEQTGATVKVVPLDNEGDLVFSAFEKLLSSATKLVAITHVSNALGTVNPVKMLAAQAHRKGALVLVDGAQAVPHAPVNVRDLDADFYVFSGHKMFGPTGTGVLYGKKQLLEAMPPWQGGGDMIRSVTFEKTTYNDLPYKFEAGTPHIEGVIGLGKAIDYLTQIGMEKIEAYEKELLAYGREALSKIKGLHFIGNAKERSAILSFVLDDVHPHDIGTILDRHGIAIRAGHHCAMPVMDRFGVPATARASLAFYNTREDIDALAKALQNVGELFR